jgi:hypothetical protein
MKPSSPAHRAPKRLSRRGLLGVAAAAAVPGAAVGVQQLRAQTPPAEATTGAAGHDVPAAATPSGSAAPRIVTEGGGPVPFRPGKTMYGAYVDLTGMSEAESLRLRREQLGRDPRILHVFYAWTDTLPRDIPWLPDKAYPLVSWRATHYADILDGSHDDLIARNARRLRRLGRPVLLRWGWEMNGDWYPWGAANNGRDASGYVRCWRRLHDIFADEGAGNVSWVWSPNWNDSPAEDWNAMQEYYPGDDYVDWVGVSGYNLRRELPAKLFEPIYARFAARKPLMITEVGAVDRGGSTKADWIGLFAEWVGRHLAVGAVAWFDTDTHPGYEEKWRVDTDAAALAAYKAMVNAPHFAG